ncbi:protein DA1-like isoform X1 [Salvia splendens]|uniref:protein DA1-like isoform X1 n=1 Tax=Salvia splendens TaxID=180675 RepID=UPI001C26F61C|nr:protein DA1-like isoform X1 [Salvia splendens]
MGWFNKIFKGSEHKVSEGQYDWRYGAVPVENNPSTSWDSWSEMEDIDRAIALSLSEEDPRGATIIDSEPQLEEDELLARAIQESLNVDSPAQPGIPNDSGVGHGYGHGSGYEHGNARGNGNGNGNGHGMGNAHGNGHGHVHGNDSLYQPISFPYSISLSRICAGCNTEIGHGRFLSCMSAVWHPECFRCNGCRQPISDYEFSMSGNYPYHKTCYKESYHPKCDLCNHFIPTNAAGLIEYRAHPFWSQKYCPSHEHDGTTRCCSCERMESWDAKFAALNDGRILCLECLDSAIMDTDECQPLFLDILEFYEGLNMRVTQQVPLLLVERQALNEAMDGERHGHHHMPETRGLCLSEEQTVSTVMRRPRTGGNRMLTEPYKLTRHCEVTAILILYGLPRLLTGSILAHELMHAWLRLNGYRTLRQDVEEGICQVLASMWLESQILSMPDTNNASTSSSSSSSLGAGSPFEKKLSIFFKHQIATDSSVIYGNGFRAGNEAVLKYGLQRTLDHMRETGNFPY